MTTRQEHMTIPKTTDELRKAYLDFFRDRAHLVVPSSSLIPVGDPTLLLTSAGMVQFKPYFTGEQVPPNPRLASVQKCFRTSDIDSVGDTKHCTFFEMLGNFSIGDYFKKEAIAWAWEFVTKDLGIPAENLWVTYYKEGDQEDLEAKAFWLEATHGALPESRIVPLGKKYNWWGPAGEEGPCGPCSEIHYSYDPAHMTIEDLTGDSTRAVEIWNNVFTQYYHHRDGRRTLLPKPNIDTGMGLERTAAVLQGKTSVYETDVFDYLVNAVAGLAGTAYGRNPDVDYAIRVTSEHARAATFLVTDGVVPSNEGRGYVLRRILRRGIRYARKAGITRPFMTQLAGAVVANMGAAYPELVREREFVATVLRGEEERFSRTLDSGMEMLQSLIEREKAAGRRTIAGTEMFRLYDTFGFPPDIAVDVARENALEADIAGFEAEMERQRQRARASAKFGLGDKTSADTYRQLSLGGTRFTGYDTLSGESVIIGLLADGAPVERAAKGTPVEVMLRETPFYAESGGQVGDTGEIRGPGVRIKVTNTHRPIEGITTHIGEVVEGEVAVGDPATALVDKQRRADIVRNHTATHMLHAALRRVLGPQVRQAGSQVSQERLRFDFNHTSGVGGEDLRRIEAMVNDKVLENLPVFHKVMPYSEAIAQGALAFFGDKYGDVVRTCRIGDGEVFSFELCGGTHADATGEIGLVHIEAEGSVGAGIRRLEAVTGHGAEAMLRDRHVLLESLAKQLQTSPADLTTRVSGLLSELDRERKRAAATERDLARRAAESLPGQVQMIDGVPVLVAQTQVTSVEALRETADWLKSKLPSAIIVLGAVISDRPSFVAVVTPDLVTAGYHAGNILREVAKAAGGGGGGRAEAAQAGGRDKDKLAEALALVPGLVRKR